MTGSRPGWDAYFMSIAAVVSTRSTCLRRKVGAVIVKDRRIISTGYNGAPRGVPHCSEAGCLREKLGIPSGERHEICRGSHAEVNAIAQAAAVGASTSGASLYCTHEPCSFCTKAVINAGIVKIVFVHSYPDELARMLRDEAGMETVRLEADNLLAGVPVPLDL